jgi:HAD superfamily hydrolase (TIGR01509 family)
VTNQDPIATPALVIFDCDGVLVDSEPIANRVLARMLSDEGLPMSEAEARAAFQGLLLSDVAARVERDLGGPLPAGWMDCYELERAEAFRAELRPIDGAADALALVAAAGIEVCVASQGRHEKTALSLALTGLDQALAPDRRFSAEDVARGKPYPDLFLHAAGTVGVEPARCAVVEDTTIGVRAALSAGMRAIGYTGEGDPDALREAGAEPLASLSELPRLLGL